MNSVESIIQKYKLKEHPEGGYYREVYRSEQLVESSVVKTDRNALTHIYFLLTKGQVSRFHKVLHDEIWNFYEGAPLRLIEYDNNEIVETIIEEGIYFKVIQAGIFQAAETTGEYTLVGCSVAPGFDFKDFSFLSGQKEINHIKMNFPDFYRFV